MDIDIYGLKRAFIKHFILKGSQQEAAAMVDSLEERKLFVKQILNYETTILDRSILKTLDLKVSDKEIADLLKLDKTDLVYVISGDPEIDDKIIQIDFVLKMIHEKQKGGILVNLMRDKIYFESQSDPSKRFIGELKTL